MKDVLIANS